jgi:hypothetical protein
LNCPECKKAYTYVTNEGDEDLIQNFPINLVLMKVLKKIKNNKFEPAFRDESTISEHH